MAKIIEGSGDPELLINHISLQCKSVDASRKFYEDVLNFKRIKRPGALHFNGAWLCNLVDNKEVSIHLLDETPYPDMLPEPRVIDPTDNCIAFKWDDIEAAKKKLNTHKIKFMEQSPTEGKILLFHDPHHYMVGICNWNLPVKQKNFSGLDTEKEGEMEKGLPLNYISRQCRSVEKSSKFYEDYLGFTKIKSKGASWISNDGISIRLLESLEPGKLPKPREIDPKDDHIAFNSYDMKAAEKVKGAGIKYNEQHITEGEITVNQLFFHDPDNYMVEICSCKKFPVTPIPDLSNK